MVQVVPQAILFLCLLSSSPSVINAIRDDTLPMAAHGSAMASDLAVQPDGFVIAADGFAEVQLNFSASQSARSDQRMGGRRQTQDDRSDLRVKSILAKGKEAAKYTRSNVTYGQSIRTPETKSDDQGDRGGSHESEGEEVVGKGFHATNVKNLESVLKLGLLTRMGGSDTGLDGNMSDEFAADAKLYLNGKVFFLWTYQQEWGYIQDYKDLVCLAFDTEARRNPLKPYVGWTEEDIKPGEIQYVLVKTAEGQMGWLSVSMAARETLRVDAKKKMLILGDEYWLLDYSPQDWPEVLDPRLQELGWLDDEI